MFSDRWWAVSLILGLSLQIDGHALDNPTITETDSASYGPFSRRNLDDNIFIKRQAGAKCGPAASGASCGSGLCCSADNVCGTGGAFCVAPACQVQYGPECDGNKSPSGQDTSKVSRPSIGNVPTGVVLTHCTVPGKVALTFDDGPYIYTSQLLDMLSKAAVKVTFFVVGINGGKGDISDPATGYPAIIQRMVKDGHQVGSHSWSHQDLTQLNHTQRMDQIIKNEIALTKILGFFPTYFRPPYSFTNADVVTDLKAFGYHIINYDLDTNDWRGDYTAAKNYFNTALTSGNKQSSSFISLEHDIHQQTVTDLVPYMLDRIKSLGYSVTTVGDCMGDPSSNWYRDPLTGNPVKDLSGALSKAADAPAGNSTLPSATVSSGAFGAQSSGHGNASVTSSTPQPSSAAGNARVGGAAVAAMLAALTTISAISATFVFTILL